MIFLLLLKHTRIYRDLKDTTSGEYCQISNKVEGKMERGFVTHADKVNGGAVIGFLPVPITDQPPGGRHRLHANAPRCRRK